MAQLSAAARSESSPPSISDTLTVILTTSPTPSAPGTELLDAILDSFRENCPALLTCRVIVVFDTFVGIAPLNRLKKGYVTAEGAAHWPVYKRNVETLVLRYFSASHGDEEGASTSMTIEDLSAEWGSFGPPSKPNTTPYTLRRTPDRRITFLEPAERLGFGLAVRSALRAAETSFVWIQQHDWKLAAPIPAQSIVEVMAASADANDAEVPVRYVCLPSVRLLGYATSAHVCYFEALRRTTREFKREFAVVGGEEGETVPLTPLFFWHDKTHLASRQHYLDRVFPSRLAMPRGAFIEDHIGQRARNQMKEGLWLK